MKAIGGYFELEVVRKEEYHSNAIRLNSGRSALEYIILCNGYKKIYIPFFTCDVVLEPLLRNNIKYEFYNIDENLEPVFDFNILCDDEAFLYTNYFGVKDTYVQSLSIAVKNVIIDNAQSFYSYPVQNADSFYSPRKFFGLPDGGYAYTKITCKKNLEKDNKSIQRMSHLLIRLSQDAEQGYSDFVRNDKSLVNEPMLQMSNLTEMLLKGIDYINISNKRKNNFDVLHEVLGQKNLFKIEKDPSQTPMIYPYRTADKYLRRKLIENRIYTAKYWPNVEKWTKKSSLENRLSEEFIHIPIDQRYNEDDMKYILTNIISE